ncbi:MAG: hypothetical protein WDN46_05515 [Methylocella sp.]
MPAPVIVMKDVGGYVDKYQNQTELYRASDREVRLHECRSACTLALSLPNVCVYPDSTLKFHLAYDPRDHRSNLEASQRLFDSYPAAVRARLGALTRTYKVLRGSELIALGIRDCNAPRVMVAANASRKGAAAPNQAELQPAEQGSIFGGLVRNVAWVFDNLAGRREPAVADKTKQAANEMSVEAADETAATRRPEATNAQSPTRKPANIGFSYDYKMARVTLPKVIAGAQPILPARFTAYAELVR